MQKRYYFLCCFVVAFAEQNQKYDNEKRSKIKALGKTTRPAC